MAPKDASKPARPVGWVQPTPRNLPTPGREDFEDRINISQPRATQGQKIIPEGGSLPGEALFRLRVTERQVDPDTSESDTSSDDQEALSDAEELQQSEAAAGPSHQVEQRLPADSLKTAAIELYDHFQGMVTGIGHSECNPDLPIQIYELGTDSVASYICEAPGVQDRETFWGTVCEKQITHIVNINRPEVAEGYYAESNPHARFPERYRVKRKHRHDHDHEPEAQPPAPKRARHESEELSLPCQPKKFRISWCDETGTRQKHKIQMFRFTDWEDACGYDPSALMRFARTLPKGTTLMHCQAGLGRSGTLAVIMQLLDLHSRNELPRDKAVTKLAGLILKSREQRHDARLVSTVNQFKCLLEVLKRLFRFKQWELVQQTNEYLGRC